MLPRRIERPEDSSPEIVQSQVPKIHEFHITESYLLTSKLLLAKWPDGRPAFNFVDLRRLSMSVARIEDEQSIRYLLQNAKSLEKLHLSVEIVVGLHDILFPSARTLKVLDLKLYLDDDPDCVPLAWLCEELEAMVGHNVLEVLSFEVQVDDDDAEDIIGCMMQKMEEIMIKPGWSALRQISFEFPVECHYISDEDREELSKGIQSLPDKYFSHLLKPESIAFSCSVYLVKEYEFNPTPF